MRPAAGSGQKLQKRAVGSRRQIDGVIPKRSSGIVGIRTGQEIAAGLAPGQESVGSLSVFALGRGRDADEDGDLLAGTDLGGSGLLVLPGRASNSFPGGIGLLRWLKTRVNGLLLRSLCRGGGRGRGRSGCQARLLLVGAVPDGQRLGADLELLDEFVGGEADPLGGAATLGFSGQLGRRVVFILERLGSGRRGRIGRDIVVGIQVLRERK